jgi:GT2 family glycosyltransferase
MQCTIRASAEFPTVVVARSGDASTTFEVSSTPRDVVVPLAGEPFDVVNNVGSIVRDDGYGLDRGFLEPDRGQYDQPASVAAWCGGAVLLRAEYLRDIGLFDERLFLYYEDLELSLRGASRWQYEYEPRSEVRHRHGATAIHGSARTETLKERNRLVVHSRYAPRRAAARATGRYLLATMSYARRDVAARVLRGRRPSLAIVRRRLAAFAGFVRMRPGRSHPGGGAHNR